MAKMLKPYIPVDEPDELKEYAKLSIVKLTHTTFPAKGKNGTAFFVRYENGSGHICHGLMTNHHVVNLDHEEPIVDDDEYYEDEPPDPLTVSLKSEKLQFTAQLKLEESSVSYAFSCSRLDVTLLEFSQKEVDRFTAKKVVFLEMERDVSASYGDCLHIYGHPGGGQLCKGEGRLVGQPSPLICYSVDTAPGFSGSPIFKVIMVDRRKNTFHYQLCGIHHSGGDKNKYNCGTTIETVTQAIDRDRPIALQEGARQYPRKQTEEAKKDLLIQHLFGVDISAATGLDPPIDRLSTFNHAEYYTKPRFYKINSGNVEMTLSHSLEWNQFTLMDVLHSEHIAVPWRDFGLDEFKAFHKLAMGLQRVCSLERTERTGTLILKSLEEHVQQMLDKVSLAEYYCREGKDKQEMSTIQKLKWAVMCKDGPEHLAHALLKTKGLGPKKHLIVQLNQFKCNDATEVELIETTAVCLTAVTSQMRIIGRPPAPLKTHVHRTDAVDELSSMLQKGLNDLAAVSVWGMGGLGKTRLVLDVVQSAEVQKVFPNLIWHEVGQLTDTTLEENIKTLAESVGAQSSNYLENNIMAITTKLQEPQFKEALLVIDNVWSANVAKNFLFNFPTVFTSRVRLIFDTDQRVTAYQVPSGFKRHETVELLSKCTETTGTNVRAVEMSELHSLCGGHPLVVAMLARNIARKIQHGRNGWDVITELKTVGIQTAALPKSEPINEQRHRNVLAMLRVIMETMEAEDRNCLYSLWICKRGAKLTRNALRALWMDHVDDPDHEADYLRNQALLQEEQQNIFTIHDVIFDLITKSEITDTDINCHMNFIENFEHHICPLEQVPQQDTYMTMNCSYHLLGANLKGRWVELFVRNVDFLEAVAGCGINLLQEFSLAEGLFAEEERLKADDDSAGTSGPTLPHLAVPIYFASLYGKVKSILKPRENAHIAFLAEVSEMLRKLMQRHGDTSDNKIQKTQIMVISRITTVWSKALFADFRRRNETSARTDSKLWLFVTATEMAEKGLTLLSSIKGHTEPAEIQRLVAQMQLASFFQTDQDGETCMHAAIRHEQSAVIFDILKYAEVWNQQPVVEEHREIMDAVEKLKIAGLKALLELHKNFENQLSSYTSGDTPPLFEVLRTFATEPHKYILTDTAQTIINRLHLNCAKQSQVLAVIQSAVFQTHQFAIADAERWTNIKRTNNCVDDATSVLGLWYILAVAGIQPVLRNFCNNLASGYKADLSWKGLISAQASSQNQAKQFTALNLASALGSVDTVTKLLTEAQAFGEEYYQTYVDHQSRNGFTALHNACSYGHVQIVKQLLDHSANLFKATDKNAMCLQWAAEEGNPDVVEALLNHLKKATDPDSFEQHINHQNINGWTALHGACYKGHLQVVHQLLDNSADLSKETKRRNTCLKYAAEKGHHDVVMALLTHLKKRTDQDSFQQYINHQGITGWTALHWACRNGHLQVANELLHHSADLLRETKDNYTCLHTAARNNHPDVVESLLIHLKERYDQCAFEQYLNHQDCDGWTALHFACSTGHLQVAKQLLHHSADLFKETKNNNTCLLLAAANDHQDVVQVLLTALAKGIDQHGFEQHINHQNNERGTALHSACQNGHLQVVNQLLHHSADLLKVDKYNNTCLLLAAARGHQDVVDSLLAYLKERTDQCAFAQYLSHQNSDGWTALYAAWFYGHLQIVNQLLHHSADLLTVTKHIDMCLYAAARSNHPDVVASLLTYLEENTDRYTIEEHLNHQDCRGRTALCVACANGHLQIVNKLLDHSADLFIEDKNNMTCLQVAALQGHQDVVKVLLIHLKNKTDQHNIQQHINHQDHIRGTALHYACYKGHLQVVNQLLDHSAHLLLVTGRGATCLNFAAEEGHHDIVEALVIHANRIGGQPLQKDLVNHQNTHGVTVLQKACGRGLTKIVDTLLYNSADYLNVDGDGDTCLQESVLQQQATIVQQLLKHILDEKDQNEVKQFIDHQNNKGETALHQACDKSSQEIVNILLSHLPNCLLQDENGDTCLQNAVLKGHSTMVECLLKQVKDNKDQQTLNDLINHQNKRGLTVIDMAFTLNQKQIMHLLLDCCTAFDNGNVDMETYLKQRARLRALKWRNTVLLNNPMPIRPRAHTI